MHQQADQYQRLRQALVGKLRLQIELLGRPAVVDHEVFQVHGFSHVRWPPEIGVGVPRASLVIPPFHRATLRGNSQSTLELTFYADSLWQKTDND